MWEEIGGKWETMNFSWSGLKFSTYTKLSSAWKQRAYSVQTIRDISIAVIMYQQMNHDKFSGHISLYLSFLDQIIIEHEEHLID